MAEPATVSHTGESGNKRRPGKRTARACDECRLRKAKCDGLNPCEACQVTDRYCTYNLSAARSTGSGTRIRILEDRLRRARAYLAEAQKRTPSLAHINFDALLGPNEAAGVPSSDAVPLDEDDDQDELVSMMDSYGQMALDTNGDMHRDFYGSSSGLAWIKRAQHYFAENERENTSEIEGSQSNLSAAVQIFDAPLPSRRSLPLNVPVENLLPSRDYATRLRQTVFTQVYPMFHFLCEEDFDFSTDRLYNQHPDAYAEQDEAFLPLLYLVLALGYLFSKEEHDRLGCRRSVAQAMRLFITARGMLDVAHLRTIVSLQTIFCLILFLISTARMASAHAFLGAACASAMRQGLHFRSTHDISLPDAERKVRRRVFWAVTNMDMYISSILGLPRFIDLTAADPAIDITIDAALQESMSTHGPASVEHLSLAASAKHMELMRIISRAQGTLFPKPSDPPNSKTRNGSIVVNVSKLKEVEAHYEEWARSLTDILSYPDRGIQAQSIKYEVYISYYFSQIVLYRAFLHYLAEPRAEDARHRQKMYYAETCVKMATKVVEISIAHQRAGLLCPASWSSIYTVFLSTICLVFAYATRKDGASLPQIKRDIEDAIRLLACTACTTDTGSVRCLEILRRLLKRVKHNVDIDLDRICAETTPCCTIKFDPRQEDENATIYQSQSPQQGIADTTSASPQSRASNKASFQESRRSNLFFNSMTHSAQGEIDQASIQDIEMQNQGSQVDEEMRIPYGGTFSWPSHEFHAAAANFNQPQEGYDRAAHEQGSPEVMKLSPEDIAAFMHINAIDEPYRTQSRDTS